jgi:hypothetical protein
MSHASAPVVKTGVYMHCKSGVFYVVKCVAQMEHDSSVVVVYAHQKTGRAWVRPIEEFVSRFRPVS